MNTKTQELLFGLQACLEHLYDISIPQNINDFVISDRNMASLVSSHTLSQDSIEQLLVQQQGEYLDISLYLDQQLLDRLVQQSPFIHLGNENLTDFWIAVEGVSHFVYLSWNAGFDRPVSMLELELQAEVDKYICASHLMNHQGQRVDHEQLWTRLFRYCHYYENLSLEQRNRYQYASHYAGRYCDHIRQPDNHMNSYKEIRRFYRLRQKEKIQHISRPTANG